MAGLWDQLMCPVTDKENLALIPNAVLLIYNEQWNYVIFRKRGVELEVIMLCEISDS